ncbi:P-loop nucleotide/nucleoside kinase family protein [Actinotalea caeni]|uniref:AAA family ATPase n=1 Tax=Actinotalea caeni TaxID=1348467 RepID=UPI001390CEC9|nr:AAA family ATPase [Actinotalea caeni]
MTGLAGSGKSALSRELARALGAAVLDKDAMVTPLTELVLSAHGEDPQQRESSTFYLERVFPAEYRGLMAVAADSLRVGTPVVIDAPFFAYLADPDYLSRAQQEAGWPTTVHTVVLWLSAPPEVLRSRMRERSLARDRWKLDNWDAYWREAATMTCTWRGATVIEVNSAAQPPGRVPLAVLEAVRRV